MAAYEGIGLACGKFPSVDVGRKIFGGENTIQQQMLVEAALAKAQAAGAPMRTCPITTGKTCLHEFQNMAKNWGVSSSSSI